MAMGSLKSQMSDPPSVSGQVDHRRKLPCQRPQPQSGFAPLVVKRANLKLTNPTERGEDFTWPFHNQQNHGRELVGTVQYAGYV